MEIGLPQGDFGLDGAASELVLLVAGGRRPAADWLRRWSSIGAGARSSFRGWW